MKKIQILTALLPIMLTVNSCTKETPAESENPTTIGAKKGKNKSRKEKIASMEKVFRGKFTDWQAQLNMAKNGGVDNYLKKNGLKLESYTIPKIKELKINYDDKIIISNPNNTFSMLQRGDNLKETEIQENRKNSIIQLFKSEDPGLFSIRLNWEFEDIKFSTECIISEKFNCVVYDPILSNIFIYLDQNGVIESDKIENKSLKSNVDFLSPMLTTTFSEEGGAGGPWTLYRTRELKGLLSDDIVATASVSATVTRTSVIPSKITGFTSTNPTNREDFCYCDAVARVDQIGIKTGSDGFVNFSYALGVSRGTPAVSISGYGVTIGISGGSSGQSESGTRYVNTSTVSYGSN